MNARGVSAAATGWLRRARSLLRAHPNTPVLAMVTGLQGASPDAWATLRWLKLHGPVSLHMCATPMLRLASRSRVNPRGGAWPLAMAKPVIVTLRSDAPPTY